MTERVIFAYLGAFGLPLVLLPISMIDTMGGHSLMHISFFASPIGLLGALSYCDVKRRYKNEAIIIRSLSSLLVYVAVFVLIATVSESGLSQYLQNQGWVLIVVLAPLAAAAVTNKILVTRTKE
jgi:hypothetical protein